MAIDILIFIADLVLERLFGWKVEYSNEGKTSIVQPADSKSR